MKNKKFSVRKFINDIHLWLGLGSGIILFLVCLSGTILAFEHEIKDFFAEEVHVEVGTAKHSVENLSKLLEESDQGFVTGVTLPDIETEPYVFTVKKDPKERRGSQIMVDPFTANMHTIKKSGADVFLMSMFRLHRWLLLDIPVGRPIVGVATIIFLVLSISGIVLWFPRKFKWKQFKRGFTIKTSANWKRINHDIHNTLGFYSCVFLVIMCITGLCWSFDGYREGLGNLMGAPIFDRSGPKIETGALSKSENITIDQAIALANEKLDYEGELSVSLPNKKNNYYSFRKYNNNNWSPVTADRLYMDTGGEILFVDVFQDKPMNVKIASLIRPIHTGEVLGMFSKTLYFLACLIGTSLPITGTLIWWNKLKQKRKRKLGNPLV
ncbi:PepSY-associated TM helix domain-containing protein [Maribacter luteus]|uniref:PepSY-associated TM helix domain-containing protein n=1 Tax=Maribacter luteus TaxID=2594478 RepID=UPI002492B10D|nr:PepSY-associated TM helix domain-containing protein [Maribacter luteus]